MNNNSMKELFLRLKKSCLEKYFGRMNDMQQKAVFKINGPLLILAGAGSGKTTVLVNRIANLLKFGDAYNCDDVPPNIEDKDIQFLKDFSEGKTEDTQELSRLIAVNPPKPWNILAITFTNKAAGELKERIVSMLGEEAEEVQASTFHSACVRILRRNIDRLGYTSSFTIYDTDDSLRVIKDGMKENNLNDKNFSPKSILADISKAKDLFQSPEDILKTADGDYHKTVVGKVFSYYQKQLKASNAVDFDDIISLTVEILKTCPDVLEYYQNRWRYVMVDEYQDTNNSQYMLVSLLAQGHNNICVVGDDDQSIYKFRGATIENILNFEDQFPSAQVIKLEQNYRCTQTILDAANNVISRNKQRKGKKLWTSNGDGEKVIVCRSYDEQGESSYIASTIMDNITNGAKFSDHVILYRMNAQSNMLEQAMIKSAIPYKIVSGLKFYERKEIKDIVAYLSVINNPDDIIRLKRIINEPKRGIGDATIDKIAEISDMLGLPVWEVIKSSDEYAPIAKKSKSLQVFKNIIEDAQKALESGTELIEVFDTLIEQSGYIDYMKTLGREGAGRLENIEELKSNIIKYEENAQEPTLQGFLEEIALYTDLDRANTDDDSVTLMTMHSAKGLEYPYVFLCGAEDGIFPGVQSIYNPDELEEERRLAYVCITRAKQQLYITNASQRMIFGKTNRNRPSRFLAEIPTELCDITDKTIAIREHAAAVSAKMPPKRQNPNRSDNHISVGIENTVSTPNFKSGDSVTHRAFGKGLVVAVTPMGGDHLIEVAFDTVGTKKIMGNYAKLKKL